VKTRAAVIYEMRKPTPYARSRPLCIEEVELEPPGPGEVLVRVRAAGLCHSDLSTINGDRPRPMPMVLGHEAAGEVLEWGPGVEGLSVGDHVVLVFAPSCGSCGACRDGHPGRCEAGQKANAAGLLLNGGRRLSRSGTPLFHHVGVSAFAEHCVVSRGSLVKVDPALSFAEAAMFGCAVITGAGAVLNTAKVGPGATVAVIGLGGVGLMALLAARMTGARVLVAVDVHEEKLALARSLGATHAVNASSEDAVDQVREISGGGVEYAFEMAGAVAAMDLAYRMTRRGGVTVSSGLPSPEHRWPMQLVNLVAEERTLLGSYMGSCIPARDVPRFIELYKRGELPVDRLMSDRIRLEEINLGFDRLAAGKTVRQMIML
jgi:alcohol dehydrogenase